MAAILDSKFAKNRNNLVEWSFWHKLGPHSSHPIKRFWSIVIFIFLLFMVTVANDLLHSLIAKLWKNSIYGTFWLKLPKIWNIFRYIGISAKLDLETRKVITVIKFHSIFFFQFIYTDVNFLLFVSVRKVSTKLVKFSLAENPRGPVWPSWILGQTELFCSEVLQSDYSAYEMWQPRVKWFHLNDFNARFKVNFERTDKQTNGR